MMIQDQGFTGSRGRVDAGLSAEAASSRWSRSTSSGSCACRTGYLRDRAIDVKDVGLRILRNLLGVAEPERPLKKDSVLVAEELTLSDLVLIEHQHLPRSCSPPAA